jgi:hypothetical protein
MILVICDQCLLHGIALPKNHQQNPKNTDNTSDTTIQGI